jgi:hypothetical protein
LNHVQTDVFNRQNRTTGISEIALTGHAADMPKSMRMTQGRLPEISEGLLPRQLSAIPAVSHSAAASSRLSGSDLGLRARVLGYQFVPFLCFPNPECIILVFKRRALAAESGHGTAMCKHIHFDIPQSE